MVNKNKESKNVYDPKNVDEVKEAIKPAQIDKETQKKLNDELAKQLKEQQNKPHVLANHGKPKIITPKEFYKKDKVAIIGFASSWKDAPYKDESFEFWGINELYKLTRQIKEARFTRWFEVHDPASPSKSGEEHQAFLKSCPIPLYMQKHYDYIPNSIPYPREEVKQMVNNNFILDGIGGGYSDYSNQITWMTLMAIYEGFKEIHIYGVDMAQSSEYAWQRASCQFAIGLAVGKGIKVLIPKNSELCKAGQDYGFETDNAKRHLKKDRKEEMNNRIKNLNGEIHKRQMQKQILDAEIKELEIGIYQAQGAKREIEHDLSNNLV